jgi:magnesium transporter
MPRTGGAVMLKIYKTTEQGLVELETPNNGVWINATNPTAEEIAQLEAWGIDNELITYALDQDEMARMERDEGYVLILLRIPYYQGANHDIPYITVPMGIILTDSYVVTICRYDNDIAKTLCNGKYRGLKTGKKYRFILYILLEAATRYLSYLRDINKTVDMLEDRLQKSSRNSDMFELLKYQKSLTYFATALRSNEVVMERLQRMQLFNQYEEDRDLLEDVLTENQQAIQMANIAADILSSMMDAFVSIISNNLNSVMKALAALTIVLNVPVIIASFYGMNVSLPLETHPQGFWIVLGFALTLSFIAVYIFAKRDWF